MSAPEEAPPPLEPPPQFRLPRVGQVLSTLTLVIIAFAVISFFAAPWYALRSLRDAARADDLQTIRALMDVPAVRASLQAQRTPGGAPARPSFLQDPLGAIGGLGGIAAAPNVDGLLTADGIGFLTHAQPPEPKAPFRAGNLIPGLYGVELRHWGPNQVRFAVLAVGRGDEESLFTFERRGWFKWRLTHIRPPAPVER